MAEFIFEKAIEGYALAYGQKVETGSEITLQGRLADKARKNPDFKEVQVQENPNSKAVQPQKNNGKPSRNN